MKFFWQKSAEPEAPEHDEPVFIDLEKGYLEKVQRFPRPRWDRIGDYLERTVHESQEDEAWGEVALQWLRAIQAQTRSPYEVYESDNFLLLTCLPESQAIGLLEFAESALVRICGMLGRASYELGPGPEVIMLYDKANSYYRYVGYFEEEDEGIERGQTGGMFIGEGYPHIVLHGDRRSELETVLVHEMTHARVSHLPLPAWLNEGLAQMSEAMVGREFRVNRELAERHNELWNDDLLDDFSAGKTFSRAGDVQELSYHLAEVLTHRILQDHPDKFVAFVLEANRSDGGEAAAEKHLGVSLYDLVDDFLGPGED